MTRISLLAWRPKGVLWDAEEREYLTLQVREWHVEDLHVYARLRSAGGAPRG